MKIAVLCLCLFAIALAHPIKKGKVHDGSMSSEEKQDSKGHHVHKHRHHHHHHNSQSREHSHEHMNSHESQEQQTSSHLSSNSESEEITEQQTLLVAPLKSKEVDHSDVDDQDGVDDDDSHIEDDDSDESDDSHQVTTEAPTDDPLTPSAAPDPFTGRGDSPMFLRHSKKLDSHDTTHEDNSMSNEDSHESKAASSESQDTSMEREFKRHLQDSIEIHSAFHHKSAEDSRQKLESVEKDHYDSKADVSHESYGTDHSTEQLRAHREKPQKADHDHDVDNSSNQSVDDHHGDIIEDNEIEY